MNKYGKPENIPRIRSSAEKDTPGIFLLLLKSLSTSNTDTPWVRASERHDSQYTADQVPYANCPYVNVVYTAVRCSVRE